MIRIPNYCARCGCGLEMEYIHERHRPVCPACGKVHYIDLKVAVLAVIIAEERVLLVKRAIEPGAGLWACPAGFVEFGEAPEDAIRREVWEETGLHVRIDRLLEVFPKKDHGLADIVIAYAASITGGALAANDDAEEVDWFTRDNLPELVFYPSLTLIGDRFRNGIL